MNKFLTIALASAVVVTVARFVLLGAIALATADGLDFGPWATALIAGGAVYLAASAALILTLVRNDKAVQA